MNFLKKIYRVYEKTQGKLILVGIYYSYARAVSVASSKKDKRYIKIEPHDVRGIMVR